MFAALDFAGRIVHYQLPPVWPQSFSFDATGILSNAETFFNGLMPIFSTPIGISIAIGLIGMVIATLYALFRGKKM